MNCVICGLEIKRLHMFGNQSIEHRLTFLSKDKSPVTKTVRVCRTCADNVTEIEYRSYKVFV